MLENPFGPTQLNVGLPIIPESCTLILASLYPLHEGLITGLKLILKLAFDDNVMV